jgi:hypothetical protein
VLATAGVRLRFARAAGSRGAASHGGHASARTAGVGNPRFPCGGLFVNSGRQGWACGYRGGDDLGVTVADDPVRARLLRRGFTLEYVTLGWNVAGIIVLAVAAVAARSVALAGFGLDSLIEIGASTVVIWELSGTGEDRQRRGLRLIGYAFTGLAVYLLVQSTVVPAAGYRPRHSLAGIVWTAGPEPGGRPARRRDEGSRGVADAAAPRSRWEACRLLAWPRTGTIASVAPR